MSLNQRIPRLSGIEIKSKYMKYNRKSIILSHKFNRIELKGVLKVKELEGEGRKEEREEGREGGREGGVGERSISENVVKLGASKWRHLTHQLNK